jgi:cobalt-precorrin-5B (C1)-methyltransferase
MGTDRDKKLKDGITTGSCAAAAAAAAIETYLGMPPESVTIDLPESSRKISIDIHKTARRLSIGEDNISSAVVIKNSGDDPDITHGAIIGVELSITPDINNIVIIRESKGVGTVTRPGLPVKEGEAAINPVPRG